MHNLLCWLTFEQVCHRFFKTSARCPHFLDGRYHRFLSPTRALHVDVDVVWKQEMQSIMPSEA
eukprot:185119-Hanusia_phi.AAC.1